jgi:hypothetical protein
VVTIAETATNETITAIVTVTDSVGATRTASLVITINPPLIINGGSDIVTTFGRADTAIAFGFTGGTAPHIFSITRLHGTLPSGITIDSVTGVIRVSASTVADTYTIRVQVQDSVSATDSTTMTIRVNPAIAVSGVDTVTTTYSIETSSTYSATGGTSRFTGGEGDLIFTLSSIVGNKGLDTSTITIHPTTGLFKTTDTTPADLYTVVITVTDSLGVTGTKTIRLVVNESVTIASGGDVTTTFGRAWSSGQFTATFGTGNRTYRIVRQSTGQIFPGITVSDTGIVRVSETVPVDTYLMSIILTDAVGDSTTITMTVVVSETVTLSSGSNILTTYGRAESSSAFVAARGTPAYTYSIDGIQAQNGSTILGITVDSVTGIVRTSGGISGSGLTAKVYNNAGTAGAPPIPGEDKLVRTTNVSNIDFEWYSGAILGTNLSENVVVKFEGYITSPTTGSFIFTAPADDGVRIYIDGTLVMDDWREKGGGSINSSSVSFVAGVPRAITLYWYENGGGAHVELQWNQTGSFAVIPAARFTYGDNTLADTYTVTVKVTDARGDVETTTMTVRVNPAITVSGASSITTTYSIETQIAYSATGGTTELTGGNGQLVFGIQSIARTSTPSGDTSTITINPSSGLVTVTGSTPVDTYTIVIQAADSFSVIGTKTLILRVNESVAVTGAATLTTTEGRAFTTNFTASKGTAPYRYQIVTSANYATTVAGITISDTGMVRISDTYIVQNNAATGIDTYLMTVIITDAVGDTTTAQITITINDTVVIQGGSNILTTYGRRDTATAFTTLYGTAPITWSIDSITRSGVAQTSAATSIRIGASSGLVTSSETTPVGIYTVTIRATDLRGDFETTTLQVRVNETITVSGASSLTTTYSRETQTTYSASGGTTSTTGGSGSFAYSIASIARSGSSDTRTISIDSVTGVLFVSETTPADTYTITIHATDELGQTGARTLILRVNETVAITGAASIITTEGRETTVAFTASKGTAGYSYQIVKSENYAETVSGITISSSGVVSISRTYVVESLTAIGVDTRSMTVIVTDAVGDTMTAVITITINDAVLLAGDSYLVTTVTKAISSSPFTTTYGTPGFTYSIVSVARQSGASDTSSISIVAASGVVTASAAAPADTYTVVVRVTDSRGDTEQATLTIRVNETLTITGAARIITTYSIETSTTFAATGGTTAASGGSGIRTFSISSITTQGSGTDTSTITIDPTSGVLTISGTTRVDTYTVRVRVTDSMNAYRETSIVVVVNESVAVTGDTELVTTEGKSRSTSAYQASKGTGPYTYSVVKTANFSETFTGITISSNGIVTVDSTVVALDGSFTLYPVTIIATDSVGDSTTTNLVIQVNDPVRISGDSYRVTTVSIPISSTPYTATLGTAGYTFSIAAISAQRGSATTSITIDSVTGVVSTKVNTPADTYTITVRVTDARLDTEDTTLVIRVNETLTLTGETRLVTTYSRPITSDYNATGGTTADTGGENAHLFSIFQIRKSNNSTIDTISAGITIDPSTGLLATSEITPSDTYTITLRVSDSVSAYVQLNVTVIVNESVSVSGDTELVTTEGRVRTTSAYQGSKGSGSYSYAIATAADHSVTVPGITISTAGVVRVAETVTATDGSFTTYPMVVIVTDAAGDSTTISLTITVNDPVRISGDSYLVTTVNKPISSNSYTATLGTPGYTFTLAGISRWSGATDTSTLAINATTGVVSTNANTPSDTYTITVRVTDSRGDVEETTLVIRVNETLTLTGETRLTTTFTRAITSDYNATGGTTINSGGQNEYIFSLTVNPNNAGITIDPSTGLLSVASSVAADTYTVTVRVTDSVSAYVEKVVTVYVNERPTLSGPSTLITTEGFAIDTKFTALRGSAPYTYQIVRTVDSASVSGITISETGVVRVANTVTAQGFDFFDYVMTVIVTDSAGDTITANITITVNAPITIIGDTFIVTTFGRAETSTAYQPSRGTIPYSFSIDSIAKQGGGVASGIAIGTTSGLLTISSSTVADTYTVIIRVTDARTDFETISVTVLVNPAIVVTGPTSLVTTYSRSVETTYAATGGTIEGRGGVGQLTFSIASITSTNNSDSSTISINQNSGALSISGLTRADTYTIVIRATDSLSVTGSLSVTLLVNESVSVSGDTQLVTTQGISRITGDYVTSKGTVPRSLSVIDTATLLPISGITMEGTKLRVASSVAAGTYYVYVVATDFAGDSATVAVTILVNETVTIGSASNIITTFARQDSVVAFTATRGTGSYTYSIFSVTPSANTDSISINASTGRVTVSALTTPDTYTVVIVVTDSVGAQDTGTMTIQVNPPITVTGGSNETTTFGIARATQAFISTGGTLVGIGISGTYNYSFTATPSHAGITIDPATGVVSFSETVAPGTYSIVVKSTDPLGVFGTKTITFIVNDSIVVSGGQATLITTYGTPRTSSAFTYTGGTVPLVYTVSGNIPGVSINQTGVVRVSETTPIGTYTETITVTDFVTAFGFKTMTIVVNETLSISGGSDSVVTTFGRAAFSEPFLTDSGTVPRLLSFSGTALGLSLDTNTGRVHIGANTPASTYSETVTVTDEAGATAHKLITLIVNPAVTVAGGSNITTTVTRPDTSTVFVAAGGTTASSGGTGALVFSLGTVLDSSTSVVNPATRGVAITSDGFITVTDQTPADTYTVTIIATDGLGETGSAVMTIVVNPMIAVVGGTSISANYETASTHTFTFINGTGNKTATVSGSTVTGTSWSLSANQAVFSIGLFTTPQSFTETLTITDSKGASVVHVISVSIAKGLRVISITPVSNSIKYGETTLVTSDWIPTISNNGDQLVINTSTGAICSVSMRDTNTAILTANGGVGSCVLGAYVLEGTNYVSAVADSKTVTVTQADTLVVTVNSISNVTYTGSAAAISPSVTVTGLKFSDAVDTVTYTYASTSGTCAQGGDCQIGDIGPGGGTVFYDAGTEQWWGRYLEASATDLAQATWCGSDAGSTTAFVGTVNGIGDGKLNNAVTNSSCASGAIALARNHGGNGLSDWYLPSSGELALLFAQRTLLALDTTTSYWGSDGVGTNLARATNMSNGTVNESSRSNVASVRAIRAFSSSGNDGNSGYTANTVIPTNAGRYVVTPSALALANARTANYVAVTYAATEFTIRKALQTQVSLSHQAGARLGKDETYTLRPVGGSGTQSTGYRLIPGGSATGCSVVTHVSATSEGTCWVTAQRAGDSNFHASIAPTIEIGFLKFVTTSETRMVTRVDTSTLPRIDSVSATTGLAGDTLVVYGAGLYTLNRAFIGNSRVRVFNVVDSWTVEIRVPDGAVSGQIGVRVASGDMAMAPSAYNYSTLSAPQLMFTDSTFVTKTGSNFTSADSYTVSGHETFSVSPALPAGISLNLMTGVISGTTNGDFAQTSFTLTAHNRAGSTSRAFTLEVRPQFELAMSLMRFSLLDTASAETSTAETSTAETSTAETSTAETSTAETSTAETSTAVSTSGGAQSQDSSVVSSPMTDSSTSVQSQGTSNQETTTVSAEPMSNETNTSQTTSATPETATTSSQDTVPAQQESSVNQSESGSATSDSPTTQEVSQSQAPSTDSSSPDSEESNTTSVDTSTPSSTDSSDSQDSGTAPVGVPSTDGSDTDG